jgi:hypothetical protein
MLAPGFPGLWAIPVRIFNTSFVLGWLFVEPLTRPLSALLARQAFERLLLLIRRLFDVAVPVLR